MMTARTLPETKTWTSGTRMLLMALCALFVSYTALMLFFVAVMAGPYLAKAVVKPGLNVALGLATLVFESHASHLLVFLSTLLLSLASWFWWFQLTATYHNGFHFRLEVLPQLLIFVVACAHLCFAYFQASPCRRLS